MVLNGKESDCGVIICNTAVDYGSFEKIKTSSDLNELWKGMNFCHQSTLVKTSYLAQYPFNIDLPIAGDYDLFLRLLSLSEVKFKKSDTILSLVSIGGVSDRKRVSAVLCWKEVAIRYYPGFRVRHYYFWIVLLTRLKIAVKKFLPNFVEHALIKYFK
jgi:hypothetical protein